MALSWSMDKIGPICRTVEDCAIVFNSIYGPDGKDQTLHDIPFNYDPNIALKKLKIGYLKADFDSVDIGDVSFAETNLSRADFSKVKNVEKAIFTGACADEKPKFPPSFDVTLSPCQR